MVRKNYAFLIILSIFFLNFQLFSAPQQKIYQKKIRKTSYFDLAHLVRMNRMRFIPQKNGSAVYGRNFICNFTQKKRHIIFNGSKVELCYAPVYEGAVPWISVMDWYKTLRILFYPSTVPEHRVYSIMIDMGHGGSDPGAMGYFSKEKNITLAFGRRVAKILRSCGFKVFMTRSGDVQIPLSMVGKLQQRSKSDLFVSIHVNSAANRKISGIETYCLTPSGAASSNGGKVDKKVYPGNKFDANNFFLAWNIQRAMLRRTHAVDRGVKRARFAVLRDLNAPGVLIETGFISNRAEEILLNNRDYQEKLARAIAEGIISYSRAIRKRK